MQNNQEFQNIILSSVDITKLMSLGKNTTMETLVPKGFVYFRLTKKQLSQYYGQLPTFDGIEIAGARLFVHLDSKKFIDSSVYLKMASGKRILIPIHASRHDYIKDYLSENVVNKVSPHNLTTDSA